MRLWRKSSVLNLSLAVVLLLSVPPILSVAGVAGKCSEQPLHIQLQEVLDAAVGSPEANYPGALLYAQSPELGTWTGAAGVSNIETGASMTPHDKFRAGSIMKTFVAVVALQLVEEGRLSLGDRLPSVLPEELSARFTNGRSWRQEVRERIVEALHLENTLLPEPGDSLIPGSHARGYHVMEGELVDMTEQKMTLLPALIPQG